MKDLKIEIKVEYIEPKDKLTEKKAYDVYANDGEYLLIVTDDRSLLWIHSECCKEAF